MQSLHWPHGLDAATFLRDYWQKHPLLMRQALPNFHGFLSVDQIVAQGNCEQTPARFFHDGEMISGPFELDLEALPEANWTLLVQSLEAVFPEAWTLLDRFSFLPRSRLDDLMVSYAVEGGGIGPHFDLYDVFLVQGSGERRWRFDDAPLAAINAELASGHFPFEADQDEVLHPGDVLYLPPGVPHHGEAITACTTYSVGGAAPSRADLLAEFFAFLSTDPELTGAALEGMVQDVAPKVPAHRGTLPTNLHQELKGLLAQACWPDAVLSTFLGRLMTGPKPHTVFVPQPMLDVTEVLAAVQSEGQLTLCPSSRMLFDAQGRIFLNGEQVRVEEPRPLQTLADHRALALPCSVSEEVAGYFAQWISEGFVSLDPST